MTVKELGRGACEKLVAAVTMPPGQTIRSISATARAASGAEVQNWTGVCTIEWRPDGHIWGREGSRDEHQS